MEVCKITMLKSTLRKDKSEQMPSEAFGLVFLMHLLVVILKV